jgi:hypothetical protein
MNISEIRSKIGRRVANAVLKSAGSSGLYSSPGHFYSPIVNPTEAIKYVNDLQTGDCAKQLFPAVDNDTIFATFEKLSRHFSRSGEFLRSGRYRYFESTNYFCLGDAYIYSAFISDLTPRLIIEVGSGFSSACALDTVDQLNIDTQFVFIEPNPDRLFKLISSADRSRVTIFEIGVQHVSLSVFDRLEAGDILFLDTTHIFKTGSDVTHELFQIIPRLKPGVIIHFHDIFDKWEYPTNWIGDQNRSWNEIYALRAFLMFNKEFEIIYFNDFMWQNFKDRIDRTALGSVNAAGSGLYLRKL